jgi:hypothetical protein
VKSKRHSISGGGRLDNRFQPGELFITYSMEALSRVRDALDDGSIPHYVRTRNLTSPTAYSDTRAGAGQLWQRHERKL